MKIAYQLRCKGRYKSFSESRTLFSKSVYINKEDITEEVIERFKESCIEGGGIFDLDEKSLEVSILELDIVE